MKFLSDNCIQEIKASQASHFINAFDYSRELNLIASFEFNQGECLLWDPDSGKTVKKIVLLSECHADIIFLPGRYVAVAIDEAHHGSGVFVYSVDSGEEILYVTNDSASYGDFDYMAVTPDNRLLVGGLFTDFLLDLDNRKIVEERRIGDLSFFITSLCCAKQNYNTIFFTRTIESQEEVEDGFCILSVDFSADGKVFHTNIKNITYCLIEGEKREFGRVTGLAHDGEHIIVATDDHITVLESACEGSIGHIIVSRGIPSDDSILPCGQIVVNHKNQLMVSDGGDIIKVYNYKRDDSLQELCRLRINHLLKANKEKLNQLPLPTNVISYLLYN